LQQHNPVNNFYNGPQAVPQPIPQPQFHQFPQNYLPWTPPAQPQIFMPTPDPFQMNQVHKMWLAQAQEIYNAQMMQMQQQQMPELLPRGEASPLAIQHLNSIGLQFQPIGAALPQPPAQAQQQHMTWNTPLQNIPHPAQIFPSTNNRNFHSPNSFKILMRLRSFRFLVACR